MLEHGTFANSISSANVDDGRPFWEEFIPRSTPQEESGINKRQDTLDCNKITIRLDPWRPELRDCLFRPANQSEIR
mgnify:CR=1